MAKKVATKVVNDLAGELITSLNTTFKHNTDKVAFFLANDNAGDVKHWIGTGSDLLDLAISNRKSGGFPVGKIVELTGLEACVTRDTIIDVIIE